MTQNIFFNPSVSSAPVLTPSSVGNGTLTLDKLTHFTVNQNYLAICTSIDPFTVFNIIGDLDGVVGVAVVGTQFHDEDLKLFLTIQQGPNLFAVGDTFNFSVQQGTDLNQQNIDLFDELPQKNFGLGITGLNKGDHNIRFNSVDFEASKLIQDLVFEAKTAGPIGNEISVQYIAGSLLAPAVLALQDLTFTANTEGTFGNTISIEYEDYTPGAKAEKTIQDILYIADTEGANGNLISIEYTTGGTAGSEVVTVVGNKITVQIESGVSTVNQIRTAIALSGSAQLLVDTGAPGTGLETQITQSETFLLGGLDSIGGAGSEVITVNTKAIKVKLQSGVSTAQQVKDALDANPSVLTLITTSITGNASNVQSAPIAQTYLAGGTENVGEPGNEIAQLVNKSIKITFVSGASTAQQLKTALESIPAIVALVDISLVGTGTELQTSPVNKTFLTGGRESGTFAFNTAELTDALNFFEGNAPILVNGITNQGDELTIGKTTKNGQVELDDSSGNSGEAILNTQKTINDTIQNQKAFIATADGSKVAWNKPTLSFTSNIVIFFPETGNQNRITIANSPITIADGQHCYVTIDRSMTANVTPIVGNTIPFGENILRLCSRIGDALIWFDNSYQKDNKSIIIGEGGSGGTAYQEKLGNGNGVNTNFPLTFFPTSQESILVLSNVIGFVTTDWIYNVTQNQIEFVNAPALGVEVYVYYMTDGTTLVVPTPNGVEQVVYHTITAGEELAKELTLTNAPSVPSKVKVDLIGGSSQIYGSDYTVSGSTLSWNGLGLDGIITENDILRINYYS